jgi:hypothetical protein
MRQVFEVGLEETLGYLEKLSRRAANATSGPINDLRAQGRAAGGLDERRSLDRDHGFWRFVFSRP